MSLEETGTTDVSIHPVCINNKKIFLVDTPGFDDTERSDAVVLADVADWLAEAFHAGIKISGIIYLSRISDNRVSSSAKKSLLIFRKLLGQPNYSSVVIVTTHWDLVHPAAGAKRESELIETDGFWKELIKGGAAVRRHDKGVTSATEIINHILSQNHRVTLQIQVEMAQEGKTLADTEAGREINADIKQLLEKHNEELKALRAEMEEALRKKDEESRKLLEEVRAELRAKMQKLEKAKKTLQMNLEEWRRKHAEETLKQQDILHQVLGVQRNLKQAQEREIAAIQEQIASLRKKRGCIVM